MNIYLAALIALIAAFAVGFVMYGVIFKETLKDSTAAPTPGHLATAAVGLYLAALAFTEIYTKVTFGESTGVAKGFHLGLLVGIGCFALPLYVDSPFFKADKAKVVAVLVNWVVAFAVVGIVVGLLLK